MSQVASHAKNWTKPQFKRLGQIRDVSGSQTPLSQGAGAKT